MNFKLWLESTKYYTGERRVGTIKEGPSLGTYFTTDRGIAYQYTDGQGRVKEAELSFTHPLVVPPNQKPGAFMPSSQWYDRFNADEVNAVLKTAKVKFKFREDDYYDFEEFWRYIDDGGRRFINAIKKGGYDALVYPDSMGKQEFITTLIFDPNLIQWITPPHQT